MILKCEAGSIRMILACRLVLDTRTYAHTGGYLAHLPSTNRHVACTMHHKHEHAQGIAHTAIIQERPKVLCGCCVIYSGLIEPRSGERQQQPTARLPVYEMAFPPILDFTTVKFLPYCTRCCCTFQDYTKQL